jgi:hypothetical protein
MPSARRTRRSLTQGRTDFHSTRENLQCRDAVGCSGRSSVRVGEVIDVRQCCAVRPRATNSVLRRAQTRSRWENPSMRRADPRVEEPTSSSRAVRELADGLAFWDSRRWGKDLGNADYETWVKENPHGTFTLEWWKPFLRRLNRWKATRGWDDGTVLTSRFVSCRAELSTVWTEACEPFLDDDITSVTWEQVSAFPILVATIKPTRSHSPVFASKFCHFLLPRVFPVVDNEGLGNRWSTYQGYFQLRSRRVGGH